MKNYRRVPYHNWTHGFAVANMMYCIIKHNPSVFKTIEVSNVVLCSVSTAEGSTDYVILEQIKITSSTFYIFVIRFPVHVCC